MATNNPYNLKSGMRCVKYMLLIINFMFMITAVLLILVGTTIQELFRDFNQYIGNHFFSLPALLVAIGCIMLLVSTFGCVGAVKESTMLINIYGLLLFLIFLLEISAAITAFCMQGEVKEMLITTMTESIHNYNNNVVVAEEVNFMQNGLECCGVYSIKDWQGILSPAGDNNITIPISCCSRIENNSKNCAEYFQYGCLSKMHFIVSQSVMLIATGATTVAFVQFLGVLCAFMLAKTIRRNKSIRETRRWQLQQNLGILVADTTSVTKSNNSNSINNNNHELGYSQLENNGDKLDHKTDQTTYTPNSPSVN